MPNAFLGVRPCDLRAITIQDRVLSQPGSRYAARRARLFVVAVNCTEPGETCFCASMGTGPGTGQGYDLTLTESLDGDGHRFLVDVGSPRGACILERVPNEPADENVVRIRHVQRRVACLWSCHSVTTDSALGADADRWWMAGVLSACV